MGEIVLVRQKSNYETEIYTNNPEEEEPGDLDLRPIHSIFEMTPYSLLLTSIGTCTTILLHSYAANRQISLEEVEIRLEYQRDFLDDCENCENIQEYEDRIFKHIDLKGSLSDSERQRLVEVSHQCPVHRIVEDGVKIDTSTVLSR